MLAKPPLRRTLALLAGSSLALAVGAGCTSLLGDFSTAPSGDAGSVDAPGPDGRQVVDDASKRDSRGGNADAGHEDDAAADGAAMDGTLPEAQAPEGAAAEAAHDASSRDVLALDVVSDAASGGVADAGTPCTPSGIFACAGHASPQVLQCDNQEWSASSTCAANQLCDSTTGRCAAEVAGCIGLSAGAEFCSADATTVMQCGIDLVTATTVMTCGAHQACTGAGGSASCACAAPNYPSCSGVTSTQGVCSSGDTEAITCMVDAEGCAYGTDVAVCGGGSCYVSGNTSSCCQNECSPVEQYCTNGATYEVCSLDTTTGCNVLSPPMSCTGATPACLTGGICGCTVGAGECGGVSRGANCVPNHSVPGGMICGCVTNGDCFDSGCCGSTNPGDATTDNQCYTNGFALDGYTCTNSAWSP